MEEGEAATFVVELSGAVASAVEVAYATSNGTDAGDAVADTDYADTSGTLTFNSGQSLTQTITVTTTPDDLNEPTEIFTVTLPDQTLPDLVSIGTSSVQGTITDNDGLTAAVTAVATSVDEGETAEFAVELTGGTSTADVIVTYTVGGTATSDDDYTAPDTTLTIGSGLPSGTIAIETLTDTVLDSNDETIEITLTKASTATRTVTVDDTATATTAINNTTTATPSLRPRNSQTASRSELASRSVMSHQADSVVQTPTRAFSSASCDFCEGDLIEFFVDLKDDMGNLVTLELNQTVTMPYKTSDDTAIAGEDYTAVTNDSITFSHDNLEPIVSVQTTEDNLNEADEFFTVTLLPATLPDRTQTVEVDELVPIEDDDPIRALVSASPQTVTEGRSVRFTVRLTEAKSTDDVVIRYTVTALLPGAKTSPRLPAR